MSDATRYLTTHFSIFALNSNPTYVTEMENRFLSCPVFHFDPPLGAPFAPKGAIRDDQVST